LQKGRSATEDDEVIEIVKVSLSNIPAMVSQREICDGKTIAGLFSVLLLRRSFDFSAR